MNNVAKKIAARQSFESKALHGEYEVLGIEDVSVLARAISGSYSGISLQNVYEFCEELTKFCLKIDRRGFSFRFVRLGSSTLFQLYFSALELENKFSCEFEVSVMKNKFLLVRDELRTFFDRYRAKVELLGFNERLMEIEFILRVQGAAAGKVADINYIRYKQEGALDTKHTSIKAAINSISSSPKKMFIARVISYIKEDSNIEEVTVKDIARNMHYSESQLRRVVKSYTGFLPGDLIKYVKVSKAIYMLRRDIPLKRIASECHFSSQSHMGEIFKKYTGMTPLEYKNAENI